MSTLKVNTVQHNTSGFNNVVQLTDGAGNQNAAMCRAWVNFNGTTGSGVGYSDMTIRASFNVSSITDHGTGRYTINLSNALTDANFVTVFNGNESLANSGRFFSAPETDSPTSSSIRCRFLTFAGSSIDAEFAHAAFFR